MPPRSPPWRNPRKGRDQILPSGNLGSSQDERGLPDAAARSLVRPSGLHPASPGGGSDRGGGAGGAPEAGERIPADLRCGIGAAEPDLVLPRRHSGRRLE